MALWGRQTLPLLNPSFSYTNLQDNTMKQSEAVDYRSQSHYLFWREHLFSYFRSGHNFLGGKNRCQMLGLHPEPTKTLSYKSLYLIFLIALTLGKYQVRTTAPTFSNLAVCHVARPSPPCHPATALLQSHLPSSSSHALPPTQCVPTANSHPSSVWARALSFIL